MSQARSQRLSLVSTWHLQVGLPRAISLSGPPTWLPHVDFLLGFKYPASPLVFRLPGFSGPGLQSPSFLLPRTRRLAVWLSASLRLLARSLVVSPPLPRCWSPSPFRALLLNLVPGFCDVHFIPPPGREACPHASKSLWWKDSGRSGTCRRRIVPLVMAPK